jgi:hypothetical protein
MSVYDNYDFVVTPSSSRNQFWVPTGEGNGVRPVRVTYESLKVEVFPVGSPRVKEARLGGVSGTASFSAGTRDRLRDTTCERDFQALAARHPDLRGAINVSSSFLPEALRGKGFGLASYRLLVEHAGKMGLAVTPHYCETGTPVTSADALRVWDKLVREPGFDAEGHVVYAPPVKVNPRRRAPHSQVSTPAFKRWFGNSKVVNEAGEPLVVYHGTCGDFSVFDPERADTTAGTGVPFGTFFFTSIPEVADTYARDMRRRYCLGASTMPVYLSLQAPLVVDLTKWAHVPSWNRIPYRNREWTINTLTEHALRRGYDGLIVKQVWDTGLGQPRKGRGVGDTYVAFAPEQIKSAIGNRGTFDPDDEDIARNNPRRRR